MEAHRGRCRPLRRLQAAAASYQGGAEVAAVMNAAQKAKSPSLGEIAAAAAFVVALVTAWLLPPTRGGEEAPYPPRFCWLDRQLGIAALWPIGGGVNGAYARRGAISSTGSGSGSSSAVSRLSPYIGGCGPFPELRGGGVAVATRAGAA